MKSNPIYPTFDFSRALKLSGFLLMVVVLAACSRDSTATQAPEGVTIEVSAVAVEVDTVTLEVNDTVFTENADGASVTFNLTDLPLGSTTFTARGLGGDIVLYKASETVDLTAGAAPINLVMSRISSSLTVTANVDAVDAALGASEVVVAAVSGLQQRLIASADGTSATGDLMGVPTGSNLNLIVSVYADATLQTLTRQGSASVDLSEDDEAVALALQTITPGQEQPDVPVITAPASVDQNTAFDITVGVSDAGGDLASVEVAWGDGSNVTETVSGASASLTLSHTYTGTDTLRTITVTVTDEDGLDNTASVDVTVVVPADDTTDVDVTVDTGDELSAVTLTLTDVPAAAARVQAVVTPTSGGGNLTTLDLKDEYTIELIPQGSGTWSATVGLPRGVTYSMNTDALDASGNVIASSTTTFTPSGDTADVSDDLTGDGGGGNGGETNEAPTANAGDDQTVTDSDDNGSEAVTLDGSGSSDDGTLTYSWSEGGTVIATGASPQVTLNVGTHTITLTVTDEENETDTDTVVITVTAPASTEVAIVPASTTCSDTTAVGESCTISVALQNYSGDFYGFDFSFDFSNDNYSLDQVSKGANLGGSWSVSGTTSVGGFSSSPATGSGELAVMTVTKDSAGSTTFTTLVSAENQDGITANSDAFNPVRITDIEGGSVNLP